MLGLALHDLTSCANIAQRGKKYNIKTEIIQCKKFSVFKAANVLLMKVVDWTVEFSKIQCYTSHFVRKKLLVSFIAEWTHLLQPTWSTNLSSRGGVFRPSIRPIPAGRRGGGVGSVGGGRTWGGESLGWGGRLPGLVRSGRILSNVSYIQVDYACTFLLETVLCFTGEILKTIGLRMYNTVLWFTMKLQSVTNNLDYASTVFLIHELYFSK